MDCYHNIYEDDSHTNFKQNIVRTKEIGNWIVALEEVGYALDLKIYNKETGEEHYKLYHQVTKVNNEMSSEVYNFYKRVENREFEHVCELAQKWT